MPSIAGVKNNMYNKLLYHLDLCILSYHLYHQSLIWPWDPYYENRGLLDHRDSFMGLVNAYSSGKTTVHGPGTCQNWPSNTKLDPILTDYTQLSPWKYGFVHPEYNEWLLSLPPSFITSKISKVFLASYNASPYDVTLPASAPPDQDAINLLNNRSNVSVLNPIPVATNTAGGTTDYLYCFEGGTGSVRTRHVSGGPTITNHAWSIMGFVLCRERGKAADGSDLGYDVHIVFRGSRSGSGGRALKQALVSEKGNPDWVTDMNAFSTTNYPIIGPEGNMSMGFAESMEYTLPNVLACLEQIHSYKLKPPVNIYITGHSLGGALAVMCASALACGINPNTNKPLTTGLLPQWPLDSIQLITYSAPTVGSADFVSFTNTSVLPIRVHVSGDPITSDNVKGNHVGANLCLPNPGKAPSLDNHEPITVRTQLYKYLRKSNVVIPADQSCISTFDKYNTFYDLVKAQPSLYLGTNFSSYLKDYERQFKALVTAKKDAKTQALFTYLESFVLNGISGLTSTNLDTNLPQLSNYWGTWIGKINTNSSIKDMFGIILLASDYCLLSIYSLTVTNSLGFRKGFVPFALTIYNSVPAIGTAIASSVPKETDFTS